MRIELGTSSDLVLATKRSPVHPFCVDTDMLVDLAKSDEYSLIGLKVNIVCG